MEEADGGGEQRHIEKEAPERLPAPREAAAGKEGRAAAEDARSSPGRPKGCRRRDNSSRGSLAAPCGGRRRDRRSAPPRCSRARAPLPVMRDPAIHHDIAAMGELERVIGVLLDDEDGQANSAFSALITSKICLTIRGARPSEGSSSSKQLRAPHQRAGDGQHLLLAARQRPGALHARRFFSTGNSVQTLSRSWSKQSGSLAMMAPICRFSNTVMRGKMRRPSGDCAMPSQAMAWVGNCGDVAALEHDAAFAGARPAENGHHQGGLAGAVGADQRDDLAREDLEARHHAAPAARRSARSPCRCESRGSLIAAPRARRSQLLVWHAEIGGDDLRVVARPPPACRRRWSCRSRAPRCGPRCASPRSCRAR